MKMTILPGETYDVVSPAELDAHYEKVNTRIDAAIREGVRGVKPMRFFGRIQRSGGAAGSFQISSQSAPKPGYVWALMRLQVIDSANSVQSAYLCRTTEPGNIDPLTAAGTIPVEDLQFIVDVLNVSTIYNPSRATFYSKGQMFFQAGEYPVVLGWSGAATNPNVWMNGEVIEVPAEMVGKLLV